MKYFRIFLENTLTDRWAAMRNHLCVHFLCMCDLPAVCLGVNNYSTLQLCWVIPNKRCEFAQHVAAATATSAVTALKRLPLRCPAKALVSSSQPLPSLPCSPRIYTLSWNEYVARISQNLSSPAPRTTAAREMEACFLNRTYTQPYNVNRAQKQRQRSRAESDTTQSRDR